MVTSMSPGVAGVAMGVLEFCSGMIARHEVPKYWKQDHKILHNMATNAKRKAY